MSYYFKDKIRRYNKIECCILCGIIGDIYFDDDNNNTCRYCNFELRILRGDIIINVNKPCFKCGIYGDLYFYGFSYKLCRFCRYELIKKRRKIKKKKEKSICINKGNYYIRFGF
jgi:hypothetical protein